MAQDLQGLLEKIRAEGVDKGRTEAERLVADAKEKAAKIVAEAEARAAALGEKAEADARAFAERGEHALQQAARDTVLSVREAIHETLKGLTALKVADALDDATTRELIKSVVGVYAAGGAGLEVALPEEMVRRIGDALLGELRKGLDAGLDIRPTHGLRAGFRVAIKDSHVEFDFSDDAIVEALSRVVRPRLVEILEQSREKTKTPR